MTLLADLIRPVKGRAGADSTLPIYSVTKHFGFVPQDTYFNKRIASSDTSNYKVVNKGQFAFATIHLDEGSIGSAPEMCIVSPMYTVFSVDEEQVDVGYLERILRTPSAIARYAHLGSGSAERRKSVSLRSLGGISIPLPPLNEQRRISSILNEAETICTARRDQIGLLEEAESSLYNERFASSSWGSANLGECVDDLTVGLVRPGTTTGEGRKFPYMKMDGITPKGNLDRTKFTRADATPAELSHYSATSGDLLLNTRNSRELVGKSAVFSGESALFNNNLMRIRLKEHLVADFVHAFLWSHEGRTSLDRLKSGTTNVYAIYAKDLKKLRIPTPPTALQKSFAAELGEIRAEREVFMRALEADSELFAALQNRAFRGVL